MTWKRQAATLAAAAVAGAAGWGWLTRTPTAPVAPKPPELARPTAEDTARTYQPAAVDTQRAALTPDQVAVLLDRYGKALAEAWAAAGRVEAGQRASGSGQAFPRGSAPPALPSIDEIAAALASGEATFLAERTAGPGPLGDVVDISAVVPRPGAGVQLVVNWHDPPPQPAPRSLADVDADTLYGRGFAELAPGFDEYLNAEVAAGWSRLKSGSSGRFLRQTYFEVGYGTGKEKFVGAGWRGDIVLRTRRRD